MDTAATAANIQTVAERLRERQAAHLAELHAQWSELHLHLGRAAQAASSGDLAETRRWLTSAADAEYDLLGDCEQVAVVLDELDQGPPAPESLPTQEPAPAPPPSLLDWRRLEREVVERLRALEAACSQQVQAPQELRDRIYQDVVLPNVRRLAQFCADVTIEGG